MRKLKKLRPPTPRPVKSNSFLPLWADNLMKCVFISPFLKEALCPSITSEIVLYHSTYNWSAACPVTAQELELLCDTLDSLPSSLCGLLEGQDLVDKVTIHPKVLIEDLVLTHNNSTIRAYWRNNRRKYWKIKIVIPYWRGSKLSQNCLLLFPSTNLSCGEKGKRGQS